MARKKNSDQAASAEPGLPAEKAATVVTLAGATKNRRSFFAILTGGFAMLAPIGAGVWSYLSPLFRKAKSPKVGVALLSQVPDDGKPYFFPVIADRQDAWTS